MVSKTKRKTNRKLLDQYHDMKCLIPGCRYSSDPAHIKTRGSGGDDVETNILPLCRVHHTLQGSIGWRRFCDSFPIVELELNKRGWSIELLFGVWKLVKD